MGKEHGWIFIATTFFPHLVSIKSMWSLEDVSSVWNSQLYSYYDKSDYRITYDELSRFRTATAGSDVVQSGRPIFDDFFQHFWPYIGNNTANVVFQMVKRLWVIRIEQ
ncbi:hypothetical protein TNCV_2395161 [Trichonephila clavipes]|nr:hypothetical protein TNCV_2395161 [Trichonephila clavipes]